MLIDKRLRHVVDEIEGSACTIDVGTDHGKVILTALSEGRCEKGIASDISEPSLMKARTLATRMGIDLDTRCGDGLSVLRDGEADTAVIAGMGGLEIVKILTDSDIHVERLILVPHRDARAVRRYIATHGYAIEHDYIVHEGAHYYPIIVAKTGDMCLTLREEYLGSDSMASRDFRDYISYRLRVLEGIREKTDKADIEEELALIRGILSEEV